MRPWWGIVMMLLLAACTSHKNGDAVETRRATSLPTDVSPELSAIDSLMWQRPDSALMCLLPYFDTCCRDGVHTVSTTHDCHYANLLLAELLYKNDNPQLNRAELLQAVDYYDSLCCRDAARHVSTDPILMFLDARAHYINGVGYYERDSVVEACQEYLKALEVMEERFDENELVGMKARFMAYTYNRLGDLFSVQYMTEQTIDCYSKSLSFNFINPTSAYAIANAYYRLGIQFNILGQKEKALDYYNQAIQALPDTNNSFYRDVIASMAFLDYQLNNEPEKQIKALYRLISQARNDAEKQSRYLVLGTMYYEERQYDSALLYLEPVYKNNKNVSVQVQVAEYLQGAYKNKRDDNKVREYSSFLSQYAVAGYEQKTLQSQIMNLYQDYLRKTVQSQTLIEKSKHRKFYFLLSALLVVLFVTTTIIASILMHKKKLKLAQLRHEEELDNLRSINKHLHEDNQKLAEKHEHNPAKAPQQEYEALLNETICMDLVQRFGRTEILTTNKPETYKDLAITSRENQALAKAIMVHCSDFNSILKLKYPAIKPSDIEVCRFFLIGLSEQQIAVLLQKDYSTIWKRVKRLREIMGFVEPRMHLIQLLFEFKAAE